VFDVSRGANFYGPSGPYGNFAGRDASRGMAKQSFEMEMLAPLDARIDDLQDLTPAER
jgi:membrane-associated progesterone receptor component